MEHNVLPISFSDTSTGGSVALGLSFDRRVRVEIEYMKYGEFESEGSIHGTLIQGRMNTYSILGNLFYGLIVSRGANLYVGGGGGVSGVRGEIRIPSANYTHNFSESNTTWHFSAILEILASERISGEAGIKYANMDGSDYDYRTIVPSIAFKYTF